eukprot:472486_1
MLAIMKKELEDIGFSSTQTKPMLKMEGIIIGPKHTPYQNGNYKLHIQFKLEFYPPPEFKSLGNYIAVPHIYFQTMIFHPNISKNGKVYGLLESYGRLPWNQDIKMSNVIYELMQLLKHPNFYYTVRPEIYKQYMNNKNRYNIPISFDTLSSKSLNIQWIHKAQQWNIEHAEGTIVDLQTISCDKYVFIDDINVYYEIIKLSINDLFGSSLGKIFGDIIISYVGKYNDDIKQCIDYDEYLLKKYQTDFGSQNIRIMAKFLNGKTTIIMMNKNDCFLLFKLRLRHYIGVQISGSVFNGTKLDNINTLEYYNVHNDKDPIFYTLSRCEIQDIPELINIPISKRNPKHDF